MTLTHVIHSSAVSLSGFLVSSICHNVELLKNLNILSLELRRVRADLWAIHTYAARSSALQRCASETLLVFS